MIRSSDKPAATSSEKNWRFARITGRERSIDFSLCPRGREGSIDFSLCPRGREGSIDFSLYLRGREGSIDFSLCPRELSHWEATGHRLKSMLPSILGSLLVAARFL